MRALLLALLAAVPLTACANAPPVKPHATAFVGLMLCDQLLGGVLVRSDGQYILVPYPIPDAALAVIDKLPKEALDVVTIKPAYRCEVQV